MYILTVVNKELSLGKLDGVGDVRAKRLTKAGVFTIKDLVIRGSQEIKEICGFTDIEQASKLVQNAILKLEEMGELKTELTGTELLAYRNDIKRYTTGSEALDTLLGGGIEARAITEFYGEFGCGKTQVCETITALCNQPVIFIDTENTFRKERLIQIAKERGIPVEDLFDRIILQRVIDADHLMKIVEGLSEQVLEHGTKVIIVDSIIAKFRYEYLDRGHLADRQSSLKTILKHLNNIAEHLDVAIIVTNQVRSSPDPFHPDIVATGGHVLGHATTYRLWLKKAKDNKRIAKMVDSPSHPLGEVEFKLDKEGVTDFDKPKKVDNPVNESATEDSV